MNVRLIIPMQQDIDYIDSLWRDEMTMEPVGGPICLSESQLKEWFFRMIFPGSSTDRYFLIIDKGTRVGEASFHRFNTQTKTAELNIKVESNHRGKGIARAALTQLLAFYFGPFGGEKIQDPVAADNSGGQKLLKSYGFRELDRSEDAFVYELSKEEFSQLYSDYK